MIGGASDSGASKSGNGSEVREKPRGVRDASKEETKMKANEEIVALYQDRGLILWRRAGGLYEGEI